jgi:hypothetical protein
MNGEQTKICSSHCLRHLNRQTNDGAKRRSENIKSFNMKKRKLSESDDQRPFAAPTEIATSRRLFRIDADRSNSAPDQRDELSEDADDNGTPHKIHHCT